MSEECQMPEPGPEHKKILATVGTWDVTGKMFMDPSQPPMETKATETVSAVGGFWTVSRYEGTFMGMPFLGAATMGYDQMKGKYVSTWVDSTNSFLFHFEGNYDKSGKILNMSGKGPDMQGNLTDWRIVLEDKNADNFVMKMFFMMGPQECQLFENSYKRRK